MSLDDLIAEGLKNSPEILAAQARAEAAGYRIPQAKSLPDPMFMLGYQNDGFSSFTLGRSIMSHGHVQPFPACSIFRASGPSREKWRRRTPRA